MPALAVVAGATDLGTAATIYYDAIVAGRNAVRLEAVFMVAGVNATS